ncbi:hypothetical protein IMSHALPRED_007866 [Imshaugia aleurites]|uniref:TPR-like protein n=1 Tax=Imshaugia aleurites TaxID=172621 RepID=A0A8H3FXH1_9LECA|nr:hypothetical protein IMSHALPRED_007866 [Imshaugia aleurites]
MSWLQNTSHTWLLIIDNADNTELDLALFLPAGRNGSILITTRLTECAKHQTVGRPDKYERLNQETATELLLKACSVEANLRSADEANARAIVDLLGCHALAIIQAGAAISQNLCSLGEYKENFLSQRQVLLECFPLQARSEYGGVYATFEVSASHLQDREDEIAKDALQLLNFYAFMHFSDFPEAAFEEAWKNSTNENVVSSNLLPDGEEDIKKLAPWHVSHLPAFMRRNLRDINLDVIRLRKARSLLTSLSLVAFHSARGMTRMHPVSHFWSRDRLKQPKESIIAGLNGLCVLSLSIRYSFIVDIKPLVSQLRPHIEYLAHSLKEWDPPRHNFHFQQAVYRLSWVMYRSDHGSALFELLQMIPVQADESWIKTVNGQSIQDLHGRYMQSYDDAMKGVTLLKKVCDVREKTLAADNLRCLASQHTLAQAYLMIDDDTKAIALFERIVHIQNETLSPEHPARLASQHELARAYLEIDETAKAIALSEEVVQIQEKTLGPEHSDRLSSQHELARAYLSIEELGKAIALLEEVVQIREKTLRPEHSDRLASQHELARAYLIIEEPGKAIALLEEVSQLELARAYLSIDETAKAIALLEPVVEIKEKTLRANHPERVSSIYLLAQCYRDAGKYERALQLTRSIEDIAQNRPGEKLADWNANLIGYILDDMDMEETS